MSALIRASAPASLLVMGEYAVLEEGGLGIALAIDRRVLVSAEPAPSLSVTGLLGPARLRWTEAEAGSSALVAACLGAARRTLAAAGLSAGAAAFPLRIEADSSTFFGPGGAKLGYGSSAAIAVGLCAVLLRAGGLEGDSLDAAVFPTALAAHRAGQGGRGSGYDVAASRFGGVGVFRGGRAPSWSALEIGLLPPLALVRGPAPVSSPTAAARFAAWKAATPTEAQAFLAASRAATEAFLAAPDLSGRLAALRRASAAGESLGDALGLSARFGPRPLPETAGKGAVFKTLGAGNELGAWFLPDEAALAGSGLEAATIDREGLRWE